MYPLVRQLMHQIKKLLQSLEVSKILTLIQVCIYKEILKKIFSYS